MSEMMKTLIWNLLLFSFLSVHAQETRHSTADLYQHTSRIYQLSKQGKALKVIVLCDSVLNAYKDFPGSETYIGYMYIYLAEAAKQQGDVSLARNSLMLAQGFFKPGSEELRYQIPVNLVSIELETGRFDKCLTMGLPLLKEPTFISDPAKRATLLNNLAAAGLQSNNLKLTDSLFICLFDLIQKKTTGANFDSALTYRNFGRYKLKTGPIEAAGKAIRRSLELYQDQYGADHFQTGKSWHDLGNYYKQCNLLDSAKFCYLNSRKALNINDSVGDPLSFTNLTTDYQTVILELFMDEFELQRRHAFKQIDGLREDKLEIALKKAYEAINRFESILQFLISSESGFILADKGRQVYNVTIKLALDLYGETGKDVYLQKALVLAMQSGAISLQAKALLEEQMTQDDSTRDQVLRLYRYREALDKPSSRETRLAQLLGYQEQMQSLKRRTNGLNALQRPSEFRYDQIVRAIGKSQFICYQQLDSAMMVFTLNNKHLGFSEMPISNELITSLADFMKIVSTPFIGNYQNGPVIEFCKKAVNLYEVLLKPFLTKNLSGDLLIRPDGMIRDLPFEALVIDSPCLNVSDSFIEFRDLPFVMKNFRIAYVSGTRQEPKWKVPRLHRQSLQILSCSEDQLAPAIQDEVDWLCKNVPYSKIVDLGGADFDIKTLLTETGLIHFAGHIRIDHKDAMNTSMGCSGKGGVSFSMSELLLIRINSKLVFINGCESANGIYNHGDGELSPGLYFLLAGAGGVVEHRWKAPDISGSLLCFEFYTEYPKNEPSIALQEAKLKYIATCQPGLDHPHYWAGMVYTTPLILTRSFPTTILLLVFLVLSSSLLIGHWIRRMLSQHGTTKSTR